MTITIEAPTEAGETIVTKAAHEGLSVADHALRALLEKAAPLMKPVPQAPVNPEDLRKAARQRIEQRIASGRFVRAGLSVEGFLAERAEDARREDEKEARIFAAPENRSKVVRA